MCGIVGYIGYKDKKEVLLNGLKELEYRGYDSAGVAIECGEKIDCFKSVGKISNLENKMKNYNCLEFGLGIAHTRWATHGGVSELNAHPHSGEFSYVTHNGIIENYKELKDELIKDGINFISQTDTEVIIHLFEKNYKFLNDPLKAFKKTIDMLNGSFAILLISKAAPNTIFFAKNAVPLIIGKNSDGEIAFSSSDTALIGVVSEVYYLKDQEFGYAKFNEFEIFNENSKKIEPNFNKLSLDRSFAQKDGYRFFMEKEIYEQSSVVSDTLMGRIKDEEVVFDELDKNFFSGFRDIIICGCGTSFHAGLVGSYLFERLARIKTSVEIASEFRYKDPVLNQDSLFIAISQSGETADTLEALKIAKEAGLKTIVICNVDNSSMVRLADAFILTRAGIEKGVASTKAFATQVMVLWMLVLYFGKEKIKNIKDEIKAMLHIPKILDTKKELQEKIYRMSKHYLHGHGFFFIGRDIFYPLALEGALKLKEISYLHAEGYPAGEMKHGPIALVDDELFVIALMPKTMLYEKTKSNVEELIARDAYVLSISPLEFELSDDFIKTSNFDHPMSEFFEMMVILQLLSLEVSIRLGNDVDMPRNLAKSVTVE